MGLRLGAVCSEGVGCRGWGAGRLCASCGGGLLRKGLGRGLTKPADEARKSTKIRAIIKDIAGWENEKGELACDKIPQRPVGAQCSCPAPPPPSALNSARRCRHSLSQPCTVHSSMAVYTAAPCVALPPR